MSLNVHMLPLILCLIELWLNSYAFPIFHFFFVIILGTIYMVINLVYSLKVTPVYEVLDWKSFFSVVLVMGAFFLSFMMFMACNLIYKKFKKNKLEIEGT